MRTVRKLARALRRSTHFALIALAVLGCSSPTFGPAHALIVTDADEYQVALRHGRLDVTIHYTFSNRTDGPVFLVNCRGGIPPVLQRWEDGEWLQAWSWFELHCLSPPVVIPRGELCRDSARVNALPHGSNANEREFAWPDVTGTYRLVWDPMRTYDHDGPPWGKLLPFHQRVSNEFGLLAP